MRFRVLLAKHPTDHCLSVGLKTARDYVRRSGILISVAFYEAPSLLSGLWCSSQSSFLTTTHLIQGLKREFLSPERELCAPLSRRSLTSHCSLDCNFFSCSYITFGTLAILFGVKLIKCMPTSKCLHFRTPDSAASQKSVGAFWWNRIWADKQIWWWSDSEFVTVLIYFASFTCDMMNFAWLSALLFSTRLGRVAVTVLTFRCSLPERARSMTRIPLRHHPTDAKNCVPIPIK